MREDEKTPAEADKIDEAMREIDALVEKMRTREARRETLAAIRSTPEELGRAAVEAVKPPEQKE